MAKSCEKATQKVVGKSQLLAHFGTWNFNKRERRKEKKISNLESSLEECKQKLEAVEKNSKSLQQKCNKEKSNAFYYKNKVKHLTSKIKEQNQKKKKKWKMKKINKKKLIFLKKILFKHLKMVNILTKSVRSMKCCVEMLA